MGSPYHPDLYDVVISGPFRGDLDWYRRRAREAGGPVLELGAGTGRISIPIAEDGVPVCALDADPGMLEVLRRRVALLPADVQARFSVVEGDMRSFRLERRFALAIVPFRAFLHNVTRVDQASCLQRVHEHLQPGGRIAFNVFHPSLEYMAQNAGPLAGVWRWTATHALPDGGTLVCSEANRYDTVRQRVDSLHRYEHYAPDGTLARTTLHRLELAYLYAAEIRRLLEEAGFGAITIAGGFDDRPFTSDTDELVIQAQRL